MSSSREEAEKYRPDVEKYLPYIQHREEDELREEVGKLPIAQEFAAEVGRPDLGGAEAGILVETNARVRAVVCSSKNRELLSDAIDTGNVSMLVGMLLPALGLPGINISLGVIALAVLILKLGLNRYCQGFKEESQTASA